MKPGTAGRDKGPASGMISWMLAAACFFVHASAFGAPPPAQVTAIEHSIDKDRVRVVVRCNAAVQYVGGTASDPFRLYFDLRGTRPGGAVPASSTVGDSVVQRVRMGQYQPGITRVVLDMTRSAPYNATFLADPPRLVIEVMRNGPAAAEISPQPARAPKGPAAAEVRPPQRIRVNRAKLAVPPAPVAASGPARPPAPLIPEQMPPVPPQVLYQNGLLTITATNSTLSDVLQAVAARTRATLDTPAGLMGQRVAVRLGPASPREVLSELLEGMDFVLVGANDDPEAIRTIMVSPSSPPSLAAAPAPVFRPAIPAEPEAGSAEATPPANPPAANPAANPAPAPTPPASSQAGSSKSPEELLEELRRLQEQQPQSH